MQTTARFGLALASAALASSAAFAQAPASPHTDTANVSLGSEYIFRGISQTAGKPTLQGGFDYAHSSGVYLGTWGSNVSWLEDFGALQPLEPRVGLLRRLQGQLRQQRLLLRPGHDLLLLPGLEESRRRQCGHLGAVRRAGLEVGAA